MAWWQSIQNTTKGLYQKAQEIKLDQTLETFKKEIGIQEGILNSLNKATTQISKSIQDNKTLQLIGSYIGEQGLDDSVQLDKIQELEYGISDGLIQYVKSNLTYSVFRDHQLDLLGESTIKSEQQNNNTQPGSQDQNLEPQQDINIQHIVQGEEGLKEEKDNRKEEDSHQEVQQVQAESNLTQQQKDTSNIQSQQFHINSNQLEPWQVLHAQMIIQKCPQFQYVRYLLCPSKMDEPLFWNIYFELAAPKIQEAKEDFQAYLEEKSTQIQQDSYQSEIQKQQQQHAKVKNNLMNNQDATQQAVGLQQAKSDETLQTKEVEKGMSDQSQLQQQGDEGNKIDDQENEENYEDWEQDIDDDPELREILKDVLKDQKSRPNGEDKQEEEDEVDEEELNKILEEQEIK